MADGFGTTTEEMVRAAGQVRAVSDAVNGELARLRSQLGPLQGQGSGSAATAFAQLMAKWDTEARRLNEALGAIGEQLGGTATTYQQQEDQNRTAITSVLG